MEKIRVALGIGYSIKIMRSLFEILVTKISGGAQQAVGTDLAFGQEVTRPNFTIVKCSTISSDGLRNPARRLNRGPLGNKRGII